MGREVELAALDLRYESYRMKIPAVEARLLASIAERGIEEPLEGVDGAPRNILLNGFKRYRCAVKLGIGSVSYRSLGEEEGAAILNLLRVSNDRSLRILEQAAFLDQLRKLERSSVAEIAEQLSRSKSWVSMRLGLIAEMSPAVREKVFRGAFPVYPYMYTLRQFMRMNGVRQQDIEEFVVALSGKKLSVRDIEQLAQGYFRGPASFRQAIREGHPGRVLEALRQVPEDADGCNEFERVLLKDLEITHKYLQRVMGKSEDRRLKTPAFHAQANLLTAGILSQQRAFFDSLRKLHDRSGQAPSGLPASPGGHERTRDRSAAPTQPQHGAHDPEAKRGNAAPGAQGQDSH
ncbi:MAG: ParB/RepB/Spo0J family partition protein [Terriglobia bacterium]